MLEKIELVLKELKLIIDFEILNGLPSDDLFGPFNEYCRNQKDGSYYMELKKRGKPKSYPQIKMWFGGIIKGYCEDQEIKSWEKEVIHQVHISLKKALGFTNVKKTKKGTLIYVRSLRDAEMDEMSALIDDAIMFLAERGIVIEDPRKMSDEELNKMFYKYKV